MNDEGFGSNFITVTDEDGKELILEHIDTLELDGQTYLAFFPTLTPEEEARAEESEEEGMILLKLLVEDGEELLSTLDSDKELSRVYDAFMEQLFEDEDEDFGED